jgi:deoxyadenosine/deoxycytidine kinase
MTDDKPILVFLEGNISGGKSTTCAELTDYLKKNNDMLNGRKCVILCEPVDIWTSVGLLQSFYSDKKRWAYTFQSMAFITKMMSLENLEPGVIYICERSPYVDAKCFGALCYENGDMTESEWKIYNFWYSHYMKNFETNNDIRFIYLKTVPELCLERIQLRNRTEELGIPIEYLNALDIKHDLWLNDPALNHPVLTINGDATTEQIVEKIISSTIVM